MTASDPAPARPVVATAPLFSGDGLDDLHDAYLHQVHDLSLDCIKMVGRDGTLLSMNRNGQEAMQVDDFSACQGADWLSFWQGEARAAMLQAFGRAQEGQPAHFTGFCPTMKGEPRWWDVTIAPLPNQPGRPLLVISRDITAQHLAQQALNDLTARLHEEVEQQTETLRRERKALLNTNEELDSIAYSMSHDLLTPVRHMLSFARLARTADGEKRERYLGIIERSAEHLSVMIDGVLRYSRAGRQALTVGPVPLGPVAREIQAELAAQPDAAVIRWEIGELPSVSGDAAQLRQVLRALCHNAVKYSRERPDAAVRVQARQQDAEWHIEVQDNGVGFDPQYGHKLFSLFQRLHHQNEYPGAGTALATIRRIVDRHGGRVYAVSQPGQGATFGFTLPVPPEAEVPLS